jgi:hypothetical protein
MAPRVRHGHARGRVRWQHRSLLRRDGDARPRSRRTDCTIDFDPAAICQDDQRRVRRGPARCRPAASACSPTPDDNLVQVFCQGRGAGCVETSTGSACVTGTSTCTVDDVGDLRGAASARGLRRGAGLVPRTARASGPPVAMARAWASPRAAPVATALECAATLMCSDEFECVAADGPPTRARPAATRGSTSGRGRDGAPGRRQHEPPRTRALARADAANSSGGGAGTTDSSGCSTTSGASAASGPGVRRCCCWGSASSPAVAVFAERARGAALAALVRPWRSARAPHRSTVPCHERPSAPLARPSRARGPRSALAPPRASVEVGWGEVPIEIVPGVSLAGYGSRAGVPHTGVPRPRLRARPWAVRAGGEPVVFLALDLLLVDRGATPEPRGAARLGGVDRTV